MAGRDEESQAVMAAATRYVKHGDRSELEGFPLPTLQKADYQLGDRDSGSGYRRAITDRITELQQTDDQNADHSQHANVVDLKPNFYGVGLNLNEAFRRFRQWWSSK